MGQISRQVINKKIKERIFLLFTSALVKCNSRVSASSFIKDMLTPTEQVMLSKRFSIAFMLIEGYDYNTVKDTLKVSTATISRVALWLKERGGEVRSIVESIKLDESMKNTVEEIKDSILEFIGKAHGSDWRTTKQMLWQNRKRRQKPY